MDVDPADYMNPDEQFEMMYADDLDAMNEQDIQCDVIPKSSFKRRLNFNVNKDSSCSKDLEKNGNGQILKNVNSRDQCIGPSTSKDFVEIDPLYSTFNKTNNDDVFEGPGVASNSKSFVQGFCESDSTTTANDLFGDTDDLDFSTEANQSKKFKVGETEDSDLMIKKIINSRKLWLQRSKNIEVGCRDNQDIQQTDSHISVLKSVPDWNFMTIRDKNGDRLYVKLHSEEVQKSQVESVAASCKNISLLPVPFEKLCSEANDILESKYRTVEEDVMITNHNDISNVTELWVDKYKPSSYLELLSDEGTNRTLLRWIKLWDKIVFGKDVIRKIPTGKENKRKYGEHGFKKKDALQLNEELDEAGCPQHKIVLLCGPPGLGKTTLAHMIALHAGYNAVEINASDDRSPDIFRNQLEAATQMKSVIGRCPRPNCLILDEIDGAPQTSIEVLVKFAKNKQVSSNQQSKGGVKRKASKLVGTLKRPVICICNDLFVPALRPLRQIALVINFPLTSTNRLAQRLVEITRNENVKTDIGAMMALCEKTNNDIRSCLFTIYCLKDQPIRLTTIHNSSVGNKDMQKALFSIWQDIFQIHPDRTYGTNEMTESVYGNFHKESILAKRSQYVLRNVQGHGDYEKMMQGVYENYLNIKMKDSSMNNIYRGLRWFCFYDEIRQFINVRQIYTLMPYMPYCFASWHLLFSTYNRPPKLTYPNFFYECNMQQSKCVQLMQDVMLTMPPSIRSHCQQGSLILDILPLLLYILTPAIRPVSIQLYSQSERECLRRIITAMIDYNLTYVQIRMQDGSYDCIFDPNVEEVVKFANFQHQSSKSLSYGIRQMLSREIQLEKVKRIENTLHKNSNINNHDSSISSTSNQNHNILPDRPKPDSITSSKNKHHLEEPTETKSVTPNHLQKLTPKFTKKSDTAFQAKDFFGRIIDNTDALKKKESNKIDDIIKSDIWFHFKEGFSNAVRRSVYMRDLL